MNAGEVIVNIKADDKGFKNKLSGLGSVAGAVGGTIAKGVTAGVVTATGAMAGLVASATKSFADIEQSIGGVETLFKDSADAVIENSKRAYQTAGIDANTYMEQVTSFSASLLQGLKGDTEKAMQYADRAIIDMSDNANKFGTDVSAIQHAYQGFAKQNYTINLMSA